MGRIKTRAIKRVTHEIIEKHRERFNEDFENNKKVIDEVAEVQSKKIRNKIAGYLTRLIRNGYERSSTIIK